MTKNAEAKRLEKATKKLNELYKRFKDEFAGGFHNVLWQIMVNETMKARVVVFHPVVGEGYVEAVLAHVDGGYQHTACFFKKGTTYNEAHDIIDVLNKEVFGVDKMAAHKITAASMHSTRS